MKDLTSVMCVVNAEQSFVVYLTFANPYKNTSHYIEGVCSLLDQVTGCKRSLGQG